MHGYSPGFALLGNVEVSSMGGFLDCGVGLDTKPSPRRVAIEKAQAELRCVELYFYASHYHFLCKGFNNFLP